jgi:hypothetical protein
MSLCINPQETIIRVAVNGGFVVLEVKAPTAEQERAVRKSGGQLKMKRNKPEWQDSSNETIISMMDELLVDCSALDDEGDPTELTYTTGENVEAVLNKDVPGWKGYISENIKLAAGREFFAVNAEIGEELIKN